MGRCWPDQLSFGREIWLFASLSQPEHLWIVILGLGELCTLFDESQDPSSAGYKALRLTPIDNSDDQLC